MQNITDKSSSSSSSWRCHSNHGCIQHSTNETKTNCSIIHRSAYKITTRGRHGAYDTPGWLTVNVRLKLNVCLSHVSANTELKKLNTSEYRKCGPSLILRC